MSKSVSQRTHKLDIEARRGVRGGYEAGHQVTHPQRDARQQAAAYRLANPLTMDNSAASLVVRDGDFVRVAVTHDDPLRLAESYRSW
jgi:hypothetical protein